jgi:hypothetical protein
VQKIQERGDVVGHGFVGVVATDIGGAAMGLEVGGDDLTGLRKR